LQVILQAYLIFCYMAIRIATVNKLWYCKQTQILPRFYFASRVILDQQCCVFNRTEVLSKGKTVHWRKECREGDCLSALSLIWGLICLKLLLLEYLLVDALTTMLDPTIPFTASECEVSLVSLVKIWNLNCIYL